MLLTPILEESIQKCSNRKPIASCSRSTSVLQVSMKTARKQSSRDEDQLLKKGKTVDTSGPLYRANLENAGVPTTFVNGSPIGACLLAGTSLLFLSSQWPKLFFFYIAFIQIFAGSSCAKQNRQKCSSSILVNKSFLLKLSQ